MSSRFVVTSAVSVLAVIGLAGCTPSGGTGSEVPVAGPDASVAPTAEAPSLEAPECLVGEWYFSQDELQKFYDSVSEASGAGLVFTVAGDTGLSFDGARFEYTPDFSLSLDLAGTTGVGTIVGSISGPYTATDTMITADNDTVEVEYSYLLGGVEQDASALFAGIVENAPVNNAEYECTVDGPLVQFDNGYGRVPIQLVPLP